MNFEKDLSNFGQELEQYLSSQASQIQDIFVALPERCFQSAGDNSDKFASCMIDATKRLGKEQQRLDLRSTFHQQRLLECLQTSQGNSDAAQKCKQTALKNVESAFNDFIKSIKK